MAYFRPRVEDQQMTNLSRGSSGEQYREVASKYDRMLQIRLGEQSRKQAFAAFDLRPRDMVLDVGCGTGLSFPLIENAVGPSGKVVGIEPSSEMLAQARARVSSAGWHNVTLLAASAEDFHVPEPADALVIFRVHEVTRSRRALEHVFGALKPGARVLVVGVKWAPWYLFPLNVIVWRLTRSVTTTREGFGRPWDVVTEFANLNVQSVGGGTQYIATGTTPQ